jgi:hypothetical protein
MSITPEQFFAILLCAIVVIAIIAYFATKYIVVNILKKTDDHEVRLNKLETEQQAHGFKIANQEEDVKELKGAWKANNDSLRVLNQTIANFDLNARQQHQEIKILVGDNTKVMQEVVNLLNKK